MWKGDVTRLISNPDCDPGFYKRSVVGAKSEINPAVYQIK